MNKAQKIVVGFFIVSILVLAGLYLVYLKSNNSKLPSEDTLYYSFTCPHCKIVEQFISEKNITSKIEIIQKEVSQNQKNSKELVAIGKYCKLQEDYIGAIPLFFSDKECYLGDGDIINFLKNKTGVA
jgi:phage FluMu protein Com